MAEKPIECSQCKKPVKVIYKEIVGTSISMTEMCIDCPVLQEHLKGSAAACLSYPGAGVCCGQCGTTSDSVKMDQPVGCPSCYAVFGDLIIANLISSNQLPLRLQKVQTMKKNQPIHTGKSPRQASDIPLSSKLAALNAELNEAVQRENYEQAAILRDQIKTLSDK